MTQRIVLAYSGGLDTSVCIPWLHQQTDAEIIALTVDVGEGRDLAAVQARAIAAGASECRVIDARERFAREFVLPALRANAAYEGRYYLSASLSRPLIAQLLVETARQVGAGAVAHGCTGKGNDQVRFDVSVGALAPDLKVLAPVREWGWTREEELAYAASCGLHLPVSGDNPFSVDVNLWGRSCECGVLEDPWAAPPEAAYAWTRPLGDTPDEPEEIVIHFESGAPVAVDEQRFSPADLIEHLNARAGRHGVGRIDLIENRLVGIKSREVYEQPAAVVLTAAHRELEALTLPRELHHLKVSLEHTYARLIYDGLWFSPARQALEAFMLESQRTVTGEVRVRLFRGHATVVGRRSPWSLYRHDLATYAAGDAFNHRAAEGFIELFGLPTRVWAASQAGGGQTGAGVAEETPAPVEVAAR